MSAPSAPAPAELRARMAATGIGYAGIDGPWWLPATAPFALPAAVQAELGRIATAVFRLFDAVVALYRTPAGAACGLDALLEHKVPPAILRLHSRAPVLAVRPDFQLVPLPTGAGYQLVATELELCPSAQGYAHAMQLGYGLAPDLVRGLAELLAGRELLVLVTGRWSEFLFDQLALCRALAEHGARARVLCDPPLAQIAAEVARGERWRPPMFGVSTLPAGWDPDLMGRIARHGLGPHLYTADAEWPQEVGDAFVFRFGYFDCFAPARLDLMRRWEQAGASFLNPTAFILESKAVLAALGLPEVRARIAAADPAALATLDRCIPATLLLRPELAERLLREREGWVLKFAGYDQAGGAWGGRSLQVGALHTPATWAEVVAAYLELPWPVVAQRAAPSAGIDISYFGETGSPAVLRGATRLRCYMLRGATSGAYGAHLTVSGGPGVSEATDAVQAPVAFE